MLDQVSTDSSRKAPRRRTTPRRAPSAAASPAIGGEAHPVAELLDLARKFKVCARKQARAEAAFDAAEEIYLNRLEEQPIPAALLRRDSDVYFFLNFMGDQRSDGRYWYGTEKAIAHLMSECNRPRSADVPAAYLACVQTRCEEILAAAVEWEKETVRIARNCGFTAAEATTINCLEHSSRWSAKSSRFQLERWKASPQKPLLCFDITTALRE
jgi:hypothetical protein